MNVKLFLAMLVAVIIFALYSGNQRKKHRESKEIRDEMSKREEEFLHSGGGDVWEDPTAEDSPDLCSWEEENKLSDEVIEMDRRAAEEIAGTATHAEAGPEDHEKE